MLHSMPFAYYWWTHGELAAYGIHYMWLRSIRAYDSNNWNEFMVMCARDFRTNDDDAADAGQICAKNENIAIVHLHTELARIVFIYR